MPADHDADARVAWQALRKAFAHDADAQSVFTQMAQNPVEGERALLAWLTGLAGGASLPKTMATWISGGNVERIVQIARADYVHVEASAAVTALHQLPHDVAHFTGRDTEVRQFVDMFVSPDRSSKAVQISAFAGMPGVGKSALALHIAHRLCEEFPDAQLYANLRGASGQHSDPASVLGEFLNAFGVRDAPASLEGRAAVYRAQLSMRRVLVLLDNAADAAQVRPLLPGSPSCAVLVTSRTPLGALDGVETHFLGVLDRDAAVDLLGRLAGPTRVEVEPEAAAEVAELCGCLPLALRIAGGLLAERPMWTVRRLASSLSDERARLRRLRLGDLEVRGSFMLSYRELASEHASVFRILGGFPGAEFGSDVVAAIASVDPPEAERLLDGLAHVQLLEHIAEDRYSFHDLLRIFAREQFEAAASPAEATQVASRAIAWSIESAAHMNAVLSATAAKDLNHAAARADALRWLELERGTLVAVVSFAHARREWASTVKLAAAVRPFLALRNEWRDSNTVCDLAIEAAEGLCDKALVAHWLITRGHLCYERGLFLEATSHFTRSRTMAQELKNEELEGAALNGLGLVCRDQGRVKAAIEFHEADLAIARKLGDRRGEALTLINLSAAYCASHRARDALVVAQEALAALDELRDDEGRAWGLRNLGAAFSDLGKWADAESLYRQASELMERFDDTGGQITMLIDHGSILRELSRWQYAIDQYMKARRLAQRTGDLRNDAMALVGLAHIHAARGETQEAIGAYTSSLGLLRECGDLREQARTLHWLGSIYGEMSDWATAVDYRVQSIALFRELGDEATEAGARSDLGQLLAEAGLAREAESCLRESLTIIRTLKHRSNEATTLLALAQLLTEQDRQAEAHEYFDDALTIYRELEDRHGEAGALNNLGGLLAAQERWRDAYHCARTALEAMQAIGDKEGQALSLSNMGHAALELGDPTATRYLLNARDIYTEIGILEPDRLQRLLQRGIPSGAASMARPTPHHRADPARAAKLNVEHQRVVSEWDRLPRLKRLITRRPKRPTGI